MPSRADPSADEGPPVSPGVPQTLSIAMLRQWPLPSPRGSKHTKGQALIVGGGRAVPGALLLAGEAALRSGAGVLSMATASSVAPALAVAVPESSVAGLPENEDGGIDSGSQDRLQAALAKPLGRADALLVGPGVDDGPTAEMLSRLMMAEANGRAVVLDAYALSWLSPDRLADARGDAVVLLTPNDDEAAILLDCRPEDLAEPEDTALRIAAAYDAVVASHGRVADPSGRCLINPTGHPGLATSGSGDVLAGILVGLLARSADPLQAAAWATFIHGSCGDRLAAAVGREGLLARELSPQIPRILTELSS